MQNSQHQQQGSRLTRWLKTEAGGSRAEESDTALINYSMSKGQRPTMQPTALAMSHGRPAVVEAEVEMLYVYERVVYMQLWETAV